MRLLGVFPEYSSVRNLVVLSGRFFDAEDEQAHNKVGVITQKLAEQLYGSTDEGVGRVMKVSGLPFTVIGTFGARGHLRAVGGDSQHDGDAVHGKPILYRYAGSEADLLLRGQNLPWFSGDGTDSEGAAVAPPAGVGL